MSKTQQNAPTELKKIWTPYRNSMLGRLYFEKLKKYRIVRFLAPSLWRVAYYLYIQLWIYRYALKLPLISLSSADVHIETIELMEPEYVLTQAPQFFPSSSINPQSGYFFPRIYITSIKNAIVTGGTNLVIANDAVICHDLYDFESDYTSEELHWKVHIWPDKNRIAWLMPTKPDRRLPCGASFVDACALNYAHWMTEVLPRVLMFCLFEQRRDVPLIVNAGLHRNIVESLHMVTGGDREIIFMAPDNCLQVDDMMNTSVTGYVPFERRSNRRKNHSHGRFSSFALKAVRLRLQECLKKNSVETHRRIFVKRNSSIRNITNEKEIETLLVNQGFVTIEPELLSLAQQVALFSNADVVVGATGAAMANLIFCKSDCKIIIMMQLYQHNSYWYWQNIACAVGNKVTYVTGEKSAYSRSGIHSDFCVCKSNLLDAIGE